MELLDAIRVLAISLTATLTLTAGRLGVELRWLDAVHPPLPPASGSRVA